MAKGSVRSRSLQRRPYGTQYWLVRRTPVRWVLLRDPQGEFKTQALLCVPTLKLSQRADRLLVCDALAAGSDLPGGTEASRIGDPEAVVGFGDTENHTGSLLGLFSLVTLFAHQQMRRQAAGAFRQVAWYRKRHPTFADALALVRKELWAREATFRGSPAGTETVKVPRALVERLTDAVCYAA